MQLQIPCWNNSTDMLFWQSSLQLHCNWWRFIAMKTHHWIMSSYIGQPRRRGRQYPRSTSFISCKTKSGRQIFCVCWVSWCTQFQTHSNITKPCPATVMFLAARSLCTKYLPARYYMLEATYILAKYKESMGSVRWHHLSWSDRKWKECLLYTQ